eukprot:6190232-Pleurochrysis_carterae.AAC.1
MRRRAAPRRVHGGARRARLQARASSAARRWCCERHRQCEQRSQRDAAGGNRAVLAVPDVAAVAAACAALAAKPVV